MRRGSNPVSSFASTGLVLPIPSIAKDLECEMRTRSNYKNRRQSRPDVPREGVNIRVVVHRDWGAS